MRAGVLVVLVACATPSTEVRYTATYVGPALTMATQLIDAIRAEKLDIAQSDPRRAAFITNPIRLEPADGVDTGFLITLQRENGYSPTDKVRVTIVVTPKAFEPNTDHALADDKLPASAAPRARALLEHIRDALRHFEAP